MAIWSARWSASSRYWVVRKTVVPLSTSCRMVGHMSVRLLGSSPVVGSSKKMIGASPTRLMAMSSRRRIPPEKVSRRRSAASLSSNVSSRSAAVCRGSGTWRSSPISTRFSRAVSTSSTAANCPVRLICSRTLAGCSATSNPATVAVPPSALDQRGQDVDGGRLARAVGAEQGEDRAPLDGERHVVEHRDFLVALRRGSSPRWRCVLFHGLRCLLVDSEPTSVRSGRRRRRSGRGPGRSRRTVRGRRRG